MSNNRHFEDARNKGKILLIKGLIKKRGMIIKNQYFKNMIMK